MLSSARTWAGAAAMFAASTLVCGVLYTAVCTGVSQLCFNWQANGSIIEVDGVAYGSALVGQEFRDETHMWGRPTNANASTFTADDGEPLLWYGPSNLSPAGEEFEALVAERVAAVREAHPEMGEWPVPVDLVTCSGSGLDPHISPKAASYQVKRIAQNTDRTEEEVRAIVEACTERPFAGIFGEERVNVLMVNLMLDGIVEAPQV